MVNTTITRVKNFMLFVMSLISSVKLFILLVRRSVSFAAFVDSDAKLIDKMSPFDKPISNCQDSHGCSLENQLGCEIKQNSSLSFPVEQC